MTRLVARLGLRLLDHAILVSARTRPPPRVGAIRSAATKSTRVDARPRRRCRMLLSVPHPIHGGALRCIPAPDPRSCRMESLSDAVSPCPPYKRKRSPPRQRLSMDADGG